jgi:hypothetical protein
MLAHAGTPDELVGEVFFVTAGLLGWIAVSRLRGRSFLRLPMAGAIGVAVLAVGALAGAAVIPAMMRPTWSSNRPRSEATIRILQPTPNEVVHGDSIEVDIDLIGGTITPVTSTNLSPSTGHVHVSIDGLLLSMTSAVEARVSIADLDMGEHTLQAEFVAADHGPFRPPVRASVSFEKEP